VHGHEKQRHPIQSWDCHLGTNSWLAQKVDLGVFKNYKLSVIRRLFQFITLFLYDI